MSEAPRPPVHERWAHLRFAVIGPLLSAPPARGELQAALAALAEKSWRHPVSDTPTRFGVSTIERWYHQARRATVDPVGVLRRKVRSDAGQQSAVGEQLKVRLVLGVDPHHTLSTAQFHVGCQGSHRLNRPDLAQGTTRAREWTGAHAEPASKPSRECGNPRFPHAVDGKVPRQAVETASSPSAYSRTARVTKAAFLRHPRHGVQCVAEPLAGRWHCGPHSRTKHRAGPIANNSSSARRRRKRPGEEQATRDNSSIRRGRIHLALARRPGSLSGSEYRHGSCVHAPRRAG